MDFSSRLDGLQQQVADARTGVQAAATESRDQLRQRSTRRRLTRTGPPRMHSVLRRLPPAASGSR